MELPSPLKAVAIQPPPVDDQLRHGVDVQREADIRRELENLLASRFLRDSDYLKRFLGFVVEHTLAGEADQLKEYRLGIDVFGRDPSFDPKVDPVVRMTARRLRAKLHEHYDHEAGSLLRIEIPKGGYSAVFLDRDTPLAMSNGAANTYAPSTNRPSHAAPSRWLRPLVALVIAAAGLAVLFGLNVGGWRDRLQSRPDASIHSVAVLPVQNLSGDPGQEYLADGITEELITELAELGRLRVPSRTSVMQYKGTHKSLKEIAQELGVDAILEGAVKPSQKGFRISVQLVRTSTDAHLWSGSYDGDLGNLPVFEGQAANSIAREVSILLEPAQESRLGRTRPADPEAYDLYLRGRYFWNQRSPQALNKALGLFNQAIARDPGYAPAYSGLADTSVLIALDGVSSHELLNQAESAALHAIALDDLFPEAHTSLAAVRIIRDWNWAAAEQEFLRAMAIDPQYAPAHHWFATLFLAPRGRFQEAIAEMKLALYLDALSPIYQTDLGWITYAAGHVDEAISIYQQTLAANPNYVPALFRLEEAAAEKGAYDEAMAAEVARRIAVGAPQDAATIKTLYQQHGFQAVVKRRLQYESQNHHGGPSLKEAALNLRLGRRLLALDIIEACVKTHGVALIYLQIDPAFAALRTEPRFVQAVRKVGLQ